MSSSAVTSWPSRAPIPCSTAYPTYHRAHSWSPEPGEVFLDNVLVDFAWHQTQWPLEFAGTTLFAIGFLALGGLAPVCREMVGGALTCLCV